MSAEVLRAIPPAGWALLFLLALIFCAGLVGLYRLLLKKEVRLKDIELRSGEEHKETRKELTAQQKQNAGADSLQVLSSQYTTAHALLHQLPVLLYRAGKETLRTSSKQEGFLLLDICRLVSWQVSLEVLFDLARNHFADKSDAELASYTEVKSKGYWRRVQVELTRYSGQLGDADIGCLMDSVDVKDWRKLFSDIYTSAAKIAK